MPGEAMTNVRVCDPRTVSSPVAIDATLCKACGGCYVDSATSFGMIRGGHIDVTMIGTLQVDEVGNIANYEMPGRKIGMAERWISSPARAKCAYLQSTQPEMVRRSS